MEWVRKWVPNTWISCMEWAGTENKVRVGTWNRLEEEDDLRMRDICAESAVKLQPTNQPKNARGTVWNKKMWEVKWCTSVHHLEGKRGELELDVPLNWEPVEFTKCIDRRQMWWFLCNNSWYNVSALFKRAMFLDGKSYERLWHWGDLTHHVCDTGPEYYKNRTVTGA